MSILRRTLLAFAALAALPALADPLAPGCWVGAVKKSDGKTTDYTVQLWLAGDPGRPSGKLHLGNPRSCAVVASYKDDTAFSLSRPTGGVCLSTLSDKVLVLTAGADGFAFAIDGLTVPAQDALKLYAKAATEESCLMQ